MASSVHPTTLKGAVCACGHPASEHLQRGLGVCRTCTCGRFNGYVRKLAPEYQAKPQEAQPGPAKDAVEKAHEPQRAWFPQKAEMALNTALEHQLSGDMDPVDIVTYEDELIPPTTYAGRAHREESQALRLKRTHKAAPRLRRI
jgi:hypothetical protein